MHACHFLIRSVSEKPEMYIYLSNIYEYTVTLSYFNIFLAELNYTLRYPFDKQNISNCAPTQ